MANFRRIDLTSAPDHYSKDLQTENDLNDIRDSLTGSMCTRFVMSGAVGDNIGLFLGAPDYNDGCDRIITAVTVQCVKSGSGGVTRLDVRKGVPGPMLTDKSIFAHQEFRPALSSSAGDFGLGRTTTVVAASASWARGQQVAVHVLAAAGASGLDGQTGLCATVWWKPSGSY